MDEDNPEPSSSRESKKRTRGPTMCKKLKEDIKNQKVECRIDFDQYGDPIGDMAPKFSSYIGSVVRLRVDINISSWDVVDEGLKDVVWEDIKNRWKLEDDLRKKQVFEAASKTWRDFKSKLVKNYMRKGKDPSETYSFIGEKQWEIFKKTRESVEFKEKSEKAKANQSLNKHPHYLGKRGYKGKRGEWQNDDPLTSLNTDGTIDSSILSDERTGRGLDWVRARTKKKEGGGHFIPNEHTKEVLEKMAELQGKISDGSWTPHGHDDVLSRALGNKEHGGRVRGVGGREKIKSVYGSHNSKQSGVVSVDELEKATERVKQECQEMMNVKIRGIFDHLKQMGLQLPNDCFRFDEISTPKNELVRSSCHSVDQPDTLSEVKIPTLCRLCVVLPNEGRVTVARGKFIPTSSQGGDLIHGKPIGPGNVKVCVDDVVADDFQLTPLPVPSDEHETVGDAIGSFVQWPRDLVIVGQEPEKKKGHKTTVQKFPEKVNKIASKESATPIKKKEAFLDRYLTEKCRSLRYLVNNLPHDSDTTQVVKKIRRCLSFINLENNQYSSRIKMLMSF